MFILIIQHDVIYNITCIPNSLSLFLGGPKAACAGCAGFAAFSVVIEKFLDRHG